MNEHDKELIYKFVALLKSKFFFCSNYDDVYYQFTDSQIDNLIDKICNSEEFNKFFK